MPHPKTTDLDMTKHSDYFVWKVAAERVARRCDDTVEKKRVPSCVLKHLFLEGFDQPKTSPKKPWNVLSDALVMTRFQNFKKNIWQRDIRNFETLTLVARRGGHFRFFLAIFLVNQILPKRVEIRAPRSFFKLLRGFK